MGAPRSAQCPFSIMIYQNFQFFLIFRKLFSGFFLQIEISFIKNEPLGAVWTQFFGNVQLQN